MTTITIKTLLRDKALTQSEIDALLHADMESGDSTPPDVQAELEALTNERNDYGRAVKIIEALALGEAMRADVIACNMKTATGKRIAAEIMATTKRDTRHATLERAAATLGSYAAVARALEVSANTVSRWRTGEAPISRVTELALLQLIAQHEATP